jgi:hypothetical protein
MIRRLFKVASGMSLLLCAAVSSLWLTSRGGGHQYVRVYWTQDQSLSPVLSDPPEPPDAPMLLETDFGWDRHGVFYREHACGYSGNPQYLDRIHQRLELMAKRDQMIRGWDIMVRDPYADVGKGGEWGSNHSYSPSYVGAFVAFMLLPLAWVFGKWRRHRVQRARTRVGCCPICGYDLRASAARCPECGTPISVKVVA